MVVRIRLARMGRRHRPFYHIRVANARTPRDGKFIEKLGTWDPLPNADGLKLLRINKDRVKYWLGVGAQPSDTVLRLLGKAEILPAQPRKTLVQSNEEKGEGKAKVEGDS